MSEKTPRDDVLNQKDFDFALEFPGDGQENLTEEERSFTFDEDYLDSAFPIRQKPAPVFYEEESAQEPEKRDALSARKKRRPAAQETASGEDTGLVPRMKRRIARQYGRYIPDSRVRDSVTIGIDLRADEMLVYDSELDDIDYTDEDDLPEMRDYMPIRFRRHGRVGIGGGVLYALFVISVSIVLACMMWMFASDALALSKEEKNAVVYLEEYEPVGDMPVVNDEGEEILVDIDQVATTLKNAGIIEYKWLFKLFCSFCDAETKMDPGTYDVSTKQDYYALVSSMHFGSDTQEITRVTFPEGFTMEQIFTLLEENNICRMEELYDAAANYDFDYWFLEDMELGDASRLEGYLFPDTYDFYQGEEAAVAISRFLNNMNNKLTEDIQDLAYDQDVSIREAIIIASLIEKEAGAEDDRATMASVIYNRLHDGWKLQLDSTVNYVLGTSTFDLTYDNLEVDDPYNTYVYEGLPPGPICNPGLASIKAAVDPADTNYWFWYAYDGETKFFDNSDDFDAYANAHRVS